MPAGDLQPVYDEVCSLLCKHAESFVLTNRWENSQVESDKPTLLLVCGEKVAVNGRDPQPMMFAGTTLQKNYVAFYFMPIYGAPAQFKLTPRLKKLLKGKACFQIKDWDQQLREELDMLLSEGRSCFRKLGWMGSDN